MTRPAAQGSRVVEASTASRDELENLRADHVMVIAGTSLLIREYSMLRAHEVIFADVVNSE